MTEPKTGSLTCRICASQSEIVGTVDGEYSKRTFQLARCSDCGYGYVVDPWLDYEQIYDDRYYAGEGADALVDYHFELEHPDRTVRVYEWTGVERVVADLVSGVDSSCRWLDYGCGNGGLVRHLRARADVDAIGFEEGSIAAVAEARGIPIVGREALGGLAGSFDVVTAIEVLEHTADPLLELRQMRALLKPGGLLFLTTGNAEPYADRLQRWRYVVPELHISLFEPRTLERALEATGFRPERIPRGPGFNEILKFKILKNLRLRRRSALTDLVPARLVGPLADRPTRLSAHPIGRAV
jgi:SAM-dependent methyltransferase